MVILLVWANAFIAREKSTAIEKIMHAHPREDRNLVMWRILFAIGGEIKREVTGN